MSMRPLLLIFVWVFSVISRMAAADRVTLHGKVTDNSGQPVEHATVLIYHAGVKKGYSTFCPSCYVDCGKRAVTSTDGSFRIPGVASDLLFQLLAVHEGFQPAFVDRVDPLDGSTAKAVIIPRSKTMNAQNVVRGRVVDDHSRALRDVVVRPMGVSAMETSDGTTSEVSRYDGVKGLEPVAATDENGDFEVAYAKPAVAMLLSIEARGFAPKVQKLSTGAERQTIQVTPGAVVRGRLLNHDVPVADAEVGLFPRHPGGFRGNLSVEGDPYDEIRVGTQSDGTFVLADVPASVAWYVYPKMESISKFGAAAPMECTTRRAGEVVDIGDIQLAEGHHVRGKIILPQSRQIPGGMRITLDSGTKRGKDSQTVSIQQDGSFEFEGVPTGTYTLFASLRGYHPVPEIAPLQIDRNFDSLSLTFERNSTAK